MVVGILGAGIAGLSTAWLLDKQGVETVVFEKRPYAGGLSRSFNWHGFDCDFAAHRLFSRDQESLTQLLNMVHMGRHIRRSQIYFNNRWLRDPLDIFQLIRNASPLTSLDILRTYLTRPRQTDPDSFAGFVIQRYGYRLYDFFFRPYTEKLFGIPGEEISVSWARTKVRLASPFDKYRPSTKTKFSYFYYPVEGGYGSIPEKMHQELGERVRLNTTVVGLEKTADQITGVRYLQDGVEQTQPVDILVSTLPLTITGKMLDVDISLQYRKVDAVYLHIAKKLASDNHWIYFMDDDICINRMVEFKNMSPVGKPEETTVVCAEVTREFTHPARRVIDDLVRIDFLKPTDILDSMVVSEEFSYPIYNKHYERVLEKTAREFSAYQNLFVVGRAAEFKHREIDDNFGAAVETSQDILAHIPVASRRATEVSMKKETPEVWAVILAFNNIEDTLECIGSITQSQHENLHIVLVDNGSTDDTVAIVRREFPQVHLIENGENLWVPAGYNVGFEYALKKGADYILLLNNDTTIPDNLVQDLLEHGEADPEVGVLMPTVAYYDDPQSVWSSGARYRKFPPAIIMSTGDNRVQNQSDFLEYAPSCGLLIKRQAFELAGLFDPGYLFLNDDWDFCERVRMHGMKIKHVPEVRMLHKVSKTTKGPQSPLFWRMLGESNVRFYRRHGRPVWLSLSMHLGYIFMRDIVYKGNWRFLPDFWSGVQTGFKKPLGPIPNTQFSTFE